MNCINYTEGLYVSFIDEPPEDGEYIYKIAAIETDRFQDQAGNWWTKAYAVVAPISRKNEWPMTKYNADFTELIPFCLQAGDTVILPKNGVQHMIDSLCKSHDNSMYLADVIVSGKKVVIETWLLSDLLEMDMV